MSNPILVTRSSLPQFDEYINEISELWDSRWLTNMGVKHQQLEAELKKKLRVSNLTLFTNGHNALECILEAMNLRGEVITTPFTFASTAHAIARKGLVPVFADIKEDDYTIDPDSIRRLISPRTCAIVPVHVYGNICDTQAIQNLADEYGLKVIYDAAHAFGVKVDGESAASFGDASMFSFHATKVFHTIEGGAACFKDKNLYQILNQWKNFGITGPEDVEYIGGNAKMNEFCAAMGLCNLRHFDEEVDKRRQVAERYWERLKKVPGLKVYIPNENVKHNYAYMPIVLDETFGKSRDELFDFLSAHDIFTRKYFYPLINDYACYRNVYSSESTPIASRIARNVLTLPLYAELDLQDVDRICDLIVSICS